MTDPLFLRKNGTSALIVALYFGVIAAFLSLGVAASWFPAIESNSLIHFDALHYQQIALHGYKNESSAFFPLFPTLWRLTGLGAIGISILNGSFFAFATIMLIKEFNIEIKALLIFLFLPSLFFLFVPYSESTFFVGGTVILIALRRRWTFAICLGILWCTLARPAFTALLPAMILAKFLDSCSLRRKLGDVAMYIASSFLAMLLVMAYQYSETGDLWGFYTAQSGYGNTLKLPSLPFTSWGGGSTVKLDAVALMIGIVSSLVLVRISLRALRTRSTSAQPELIVSLGYIATVSAIALFLRGGELYSLNRFVMASPFILIVIAAYIDKPRAIEVKRLFLIGTAILTYFMLFGAYVHIQTFVSFILLTVYLIALVNVVSKPTRSIGWAFWTWLVIACCIQLYYLTRYLENKWVA